MGNRRNTELLLLALGAVPVFLLYAMYVIQQGGQPSFETLVVPIGLAAAFKVGTAGVLATSITDDVGWTGIIVAWLSQMNTAVIFVVSALIGMLRYGSTVAAATFARVDSSFANMLQGAILFLVLAADFCTRFKVVPVKKGGNDNGNG